jgi:hypothetical protein
MQDLKTLILRTIAAVHHQINQTVGILSPDGHSKSPLSAQSAATATAPVGAGRRTRKHSGIIATQSHAEK